jgi:hypothetical protein
VRTISWMHQSFGNVGDLDGKILGASETLVFEIYTGCMCTGCVYIEGILRWYEDRVHTVDRMVKTCV